MKGKCRKESKADGEFTTIKVVKNIRGVLLTIRSTDTEDITFCQELSTKVTGAVE